MVSPYTIERPAQGQGAQQGAYTLERPQSDAPTRQRTNPTITGEDGETYELTDRREQELYNTMLELHEQGDERGARRASAELAGMISARDDEGSLEARLSRGEGALRGLTQGMFGIGDYISAGAGALTSAVRSAVDPDQERIRFDEMRAAQRGRRRALAADNPVSSGAGYVAGAVTSGGPAARLAGGALRRVGPVGQRAADALRITRGQTGRNVARVAAGGAASGGTAAAVESDFDPGTAARGAAMGGIGAPLIGGAVRGLGDVGSALMQPFRPQRAATAAALRRLTKVRNDRLPEGAPRSTAEDVAADLNRRGAEFERVTGRAPRLVELLEEDEARELADVLRLGTRGSARMREAEVQAGAERATNVPRAISRGAPRVSQTAEREVRDASMDQIMGQIETRPVDITIEDARLLTTPEVRQALGSTNFGRLLERIDPENLAASSAPTRGDEIVGRLTVREVDDIRQALAERGNAPGFARVFSGLSRQVSEIGRRAVPEYGDALDEFAQRSAGIEGIRIGRGVTAGGDTEDFVSQLSPAVAERQTGLGRTGTALRRQGARAGARTRLAEAAGEGPVSATRVTRDLAENPDLARRVEATLGADEAARLQRLGEAELRGARALSVAAPQLKTVSRQQQEAVGEAIRGVVLAGGRASGAFQAVAAERLLGYVKNNPARAARLAEALTDPDVAPRAIAQLQRLGATQDQIAQIYVDAARAAGVMSGDVAAGNQPPETQQP